MEVRTEIPECCFANKRLAALVAREFLRAVAKANEVYLKAHPRTPALYQSGIVYKQEPWAGKYEQFATIPQVLEQGWGDCDDLTAWRVAEIRQVLKKPADFICYWRPNTMTWHLQVRYWDSIADRRAHPQGGYVEDPSRLLGMGYKE